MRGAPDFGLSLDSDAYTLVRRASGVSLILLPNSGAIIPFLLFWHLEYINLKTISIWYCVKCYTRSLAELKGIYVDLNNHLICLISISSLHVKHEFCFFCFPIKWVFGKVRSTLALMWLNLLFPLESWMMVPFFMFINQKKLHHEFQCLKYHHRCLF